MTGRRRPHPRLTVLALAGILAAPPPPAFAQLPTNKPKPPPAEAPPPPPPAAAPTAPPAAAPTAAPAGEGKEQQGAKTFSQQELDELLAPIALYPDSLLAQTLMASTYPLEIVEAARWREKNPKLKEKELEDALQKQQWDPSVKSVVAVPDVLKMMNEKLDWTQKLGDAFLAQEADVMATVQKLRGKAKEAGTLKDSKEQTVSTKEESGTQVIVIEQSNPQVVYVPTYNPAVVYGTWWYPTPPPYYYYPAGYAIGVGLAFTTAAFVGAAMWGGVRWGYGGYGGSVNVNVNRYNSFNRTNINNSNWNHNVNHRKGVAYRDSGTAQRYNRGGNAQAAQARQQYRGRSGSGELGGASGANRSAGQRSGSGSGSLGGSGASSRSGSGGSGSWGGGGSSFSSGGSRSSGSRSSGGFSGAFGGGSSTRAASARGGMSRGGGGGRGRR